jgi:hypothetical protein
MKNKTLRATLGSLAAAVFALGSTSGNAAVVTYIDLFNTGQQVSTNNAIVTNTVSSAGAIGGFRTLTLNTSGGDPEFPQNSAITVSSLTQRFTLSTPADTVSNFEIKWGGAGGTSGFGPVDFTGALGTNFSLPSSTLNFALRSTDQANSFTWTFTDTANNVASYTGTFPIHSSTNPALPYALSLASFGGSGIVDWTSINFITLAGGGVVDLDMGIFAPISVTAQPIPEPGTWAAAGLLLLTAVYIRWRRSRSTTTEEAPAVA